MSKAERCQTCAFREGTEASRAEHTVLLATICVEARDPFMCHEDSHVCRGWAAAVEEAKAAQPNQPAWKRAVAQAMADEYAEALNELAMGHRIDEEAVIARVHQRVLAVLSEAV